MKHIVLIGDSIFDNAEYVDNNDAVIDQLQTNLSATSKATLLAVDGDVTTEVHAQLEQIPVDVTHVFLSCGGNDALRIANILDQPTTTVGEAMEIFTEIKSDFQNRYRKLLFAIKDKVTNLVICTIHDSVPEIEPRALTALSLFNEVILKEAFAIKAPVIDLRLLCNEENDYSSISPIEPSKQGAKKIVGQIIKVIESYDFKESDSSVYS